MKKNNPDIKKEVFGALLQSLSVYKTGSKEILFVMFALGLISVSVELFLPKTTSVSVALLVIVLIIASFAVSRNILKATAVSSYFGDDFQQAMKLSQASNKTVIGADLYSFFAGFVIYLGIVQFTLSLLISKSISEQLCAFAIGTELAWFILSLTFVQKYTNTSILLKNIVGTRQFLTGLKTGVRDMCQTLPYSVPMMALQGLFLIPTIGILLHISLPAKIASVIYVVVTMPMFIIPTPLLMLRMQDKPKHCFLTGFLVISLLFVALAVIYTALFQELFMGFGYDLINTMLINDTP